MKPQILYYVLLACIGILVIAGGTGYYLSHVRLQEKITRMETLKADIVLARERIGYLEELDQSYTEIRSIENTMKRMLPEEKKQAQVAAKIYSMIDSAELKSNDLSFENTSGAPGNDTQTTASEIDGVRVMPVHFKVEGSYRQLLVFLDLVERQERLMQVTSLNIQRSDEAGSLSFDIKLEVFLSP